MKYIFGPVPSRRLGISLGIDLVMHKTCTFDCVYCECGETTQKIVERKEYVPYNQVIEDLNEFLSENPYLDYITFSGSGEPTLNSRIGDIIKYIKDNYPQYKLAVLTNGSLLYEKEVRKELMNADLVIPSLDAATQEVFEKINRPHEKISVEKVIDGLMQFSKEFQGEIWVEIFIAKNINDDKEQILEIKKVLDRMKPEKIQINTLDRPGTVKDIQAIDHDKLKQIQGWIPGSEIIAKFKQDKKLEFLKIKADIRDSIMRVLTRRPMTFEDLQVILNIKVVELQKHIRLLMEQDQIEEIKQDRGIFYRKRDRD